MSKEDKIVFCTGGGCTAKLGAGVLSRILEKLPRGRLWTFFRRWWTTPIPLGRSQPQTP